MARLTLKASRKVFNTTECIIPEYVEGCVARYANFVFARCVASPLSSAKYDTTTVIIGHLMLAPSFMKQIEKEVMQKVEAYLKRRIPVEVIQ